MNRRARGGGTRIASGLLVALVGAGAVGHAAGGWYFSGVIIADAFVPTEGALRYDTAVVSVDGDSLLLRAADGDADAGRGVRMGFRVGDTYLQLGEPAAVGDGAVRRPFSLVTGTLPAPGAVGAFDTAAFPDPEAAGLQVRETVFDAPLGRLTAWEVDGDPRRWVIHIHGKGATRREALRLMRPVAAAGYHQLAITYRNDAGAPGDPSGLYRYGETEWEDLAAAVDYAVAGGAERIVLVGYSTGGSITTSYLLRTAGGPVVGAFLDAPNVNMAETVSLHASRRSLPFGLPIPPTLTAVARAFASARTDMNWETIDYTARADRIRVPVLVVHGDADDWVPVETSRHLAAANPEKIRLVEFPGAGHVASWNADPDRYEDLALSFLADLLA